MRYNISVSKILSCVGAPEKILINATYECPVSSLDCKLVRYVSVVRNDLQTH